MNPIYEFTLKEGSKVKMENFIGTKSWRKILEGLKQKVGIFIGTKNIFNPYYYFFKGYLTLIIIMLKNYSGLKMLDRHWFNNNNNINNNNNFIEKCYYYCVEEL